MKIIHYKYPRRGIRIEAARAGVLEADNILIRRLAGQLQSEGKVVNKEEFPDRWETTVEHSMDDLQVIDGGPC